jgi:hypothetical protein
MKMCGCCWKAFQDRVLTQKVVTRNKSGRISPRLGILDENAYYKKSGLYIEVGRISQSSEKKLVKKE